MSGADYNIAVSMFFIPYILCEVPSNMILAKFSRPSRYIGILVTCWGTIVTMGGLVQNLAGLSVVRFLIGVFEAGFFPGAIWLISQWYPPYKTQSRTALFYLSSAVSGAFSGLLAAGIAQLDGVAGLRGWRWIFILEGILSVAFGLASFFLLPDTPSLSGSWLSEPERRYLNLIHYATRGAGAGQAASQVTNPEAKKRFNWKTVRQVLTDHHLYLQALIFASNTIPNNGFKLTMPQIISNMGYRSTTAQLLSAPPYLAGAIAAVVSSLWADRRSHRMPPIVFFQSLVLISMAVLFAYSPRILDNIALCYTMVVLACVGMYPIIPANQVSTRYLHSSRVELTTKSGMDRQQPRWSRETGERYCLHGHHGQHGRLCRQLGLPRIREARVPHRLRHLSRHRGRGHRRGLDPGMAVQPAQQALAGLFPRRDQGHVQ